MNQFYIHTINLRKVIIKMKNVEIYKLIDMKLLSSHSCKLRLFISFQLSRRRVILELWHRLFPLL